MHHVTTVVHQKADRQFVLFTQTDSLISVEEEMRKENRLIRERWKRGEKINAVQNLLVAPGEVEK